MVKALHQAGIEAILDVVFNHTGEGDHLGPTISFKGIDNSIYYVLDPTNKQRYVDYSGCGNTFKCNHPLGVKLITDCLEFWAKEMHVDGFRLDEGSILARGGDGRTLPYPPVLWYIELDEVLADAKLIAEAWDAAGLYQVGRFPGYRWAEWNGRYRDDIRRFVRGDPGMVGKVASCIAGSADLYQATGHIPINAINFITCHDGFTLNDLVSYDHKHNEANGEDNRDGTNDNRSWNCGVEGPTDDAAVEKLRNRQLKNFLTITMIAAGMPMILMGDEVRRTQLGNNNAYCQDNETSWFDWTLLASHRDVHRFVAPLNEQRLSRGLESDGQSLSLNQLLRGTNLAWHGIKLGQPDWSDSSHSIAFTVEIRRERLLYHLIFNAYSEPLDFELPRVDKAGENRWRRWIDTALDSPHDITQLEAAESVPGDAYRAEAHSVVMLFAIV